MLFVTSSLKGCCLFFRAFYFSSVKKSGTRVSMEIYIMPVFLPLFPLVIDNLYDENAQGWTQKYDVLAYMKSSSPKQRRFEDLASGVVQDGPPVN